MVLKSLHSCALLTFGIGTNMLSLKSSRMYPDLYILVIRLVIICIPFSPMHCSSSAEMLSLPQAFLFGRSLITASISSLLIVYTSFSICSYQLYRLLLCFHPFTIFSHTQPISSLLQLFH